MHQQEQQNRTRGQRVGREEQRPPPDTVYDKTGQRRDQGRGGEEEERQAGSGGAAGKALHPDSHREPQTGVAKQRKRLASDVNAGGTMPEQAAHDR
jgi:hypothetical protein